MARIPQITIWLALLCGYMPYNMGFALFNPLLLLVYSFLAILVAATLVPAQPGWKNVAISAGAAQATLLGAVLVVNAFSGVNEFAWPSLDLWAIGILCSFTGAMAVLGLNAWMTRKGWSEEQRRTRLRIAFVCLALPILFNSYLPYAAKVWIGEHTTNEDLRVFGLGSAAVFVGTWRLTR